ncbi:hypothetical protein E3H11_16690 [Bradyrhizobium brasilense]|nr:hypothetical protein [Bradyrhizobium brasilense]
MPQSHRDAAILLDIGKDHRVGIQPHRLHRGIPIIDGFAAERGNVVVRVFCFRETREIVPRLAHSEAGVDTLTSKLGPQPAGRNRPAARQVIKIQKHVGGQIARMGVADRTTIKKPGAQLPLLYKDILAEIVCKGWDMPRFMALRAQQLLPVSTSHLAGVRVAKFTGDGHRATRCSSFDLMPPPFQVKSGSASAGSIVSFLS